MFGVFAHFFFRFCSSRRVSNSRGSWNLLFSRARVFCVALSNESKAATCVGTLETYDIRKVRRHALGIHEVLAFKLFRRWTSPWPRWLCCGKVFFRLSVRINLSIALLLVLRVPLLVSSRDEAAACWKWLHSANRFHLRRWARYYLQLSSMAYGGMSRLNVLPQPPLGDLRYFATIRVLEPDLLIYDAS